MSDIKVSIVIPVYNGSNYMREAIDSALAQTCENVEVIVVNDGSNDNGKTEEIALSYGNKIRYFHKENGGVASALNLGIRKMTGDWFAWLSHDDTFSKNRIEEDIKIIESDPDIKIVFCKVALVDMSGKIIEVSDYPIKEVRTPWDVMTLKGVHMCCITIHKSCFTEAGMFNESNKTTQDIEMSLLLSKHYGFVLNNNSETYVRLHPESGSATTKEQHKKDSLLLARFIHENIGLFDFFPHLENKEAAMIAECWQKLGDLYNYFGASDFADECYGKGYEVNKKIFSRIGVKHFVGSKILNSVFNKSQYFLSIYKKIRNE